MTAPQPPEPNPGPAPTAQPAPQPGVRRPWWRRTWVLIAAAGVVVLAVAAALVLPRLLDRGPYAAAGPDDSTGHRLATTLSQSMTCTAGEIGKQRSVLACFDQDEHLVEIVFAQTDEEGRVASYTAETHALEDDPTAPSDGHGHAQGDADATLALANEVAAIVTPDTNFDDCTFDRTTAYYCFAEVAEWRADSPQAVESTGKGQDLPEAKAITEALADAGWQCDPLGCKHGGASVATQEGTTGVVVQFAAPVPSEAIAPVAHATLAGVPGIDELKKWASGLDGSVDIVVADGLVAGYVPQSGGGILVVEEVAGVIAQST
ncbi:hypothetical protein EK0264_12405 [Epidermidibacterium keratini]|uniref:Uncharacterized protein n=1 Tax=Epidermidibacterium keratini TaxID=1891644 RepID=A0A7L4YQE4_9ACTN|nr:hypothetical protein [Epidermidibacterium keratini]QHC01009.1 hypothetical protein EK0264_12405 [Epidermidibacterium keratini]